MHHWEIRSGSKDGPGGTVNAAFDPKIDSRSMDEVAYLKLITESDGPPNMINDLNYVNNAFASEGHPCAYLGKCVEGDFCAKYATKVDAKRACIKYGNHCKGRVSKNDCSSSSGSGSSDGSGGKGSPCATAGGSSSPIESGAADPVLDMHHWELRWGSKPQGNTQEVSYVK